eukprot:735655-Pleurochrysis_carterae.AAC.1
MGHTNRAASAPSSGPSIEAKRRKNLSLMRYVRAALQPRRLCHKRCHSSSLHIAMYVEDEAKGL